MKRIPCSWIRCGLKQHTSGEKGSRDYPLQHVLSLDIRSEQGETMVTWNFFTTIVQTNTRLILQGHIY